MNARGLVLIELVIALAIVSLAIVIGVALAAVLFLGLSA